ncbi:MAG: proline racemase family protein [Terriglobales bacterium]
MATAAGRTVTILDSHTAGEPTRLVLAGGPELGAGTMAERLERLRRDHDGFRCAVLNEPRGSDIIVGALWLEPQDRGCAAGVIFFNNVGYLGMCGHGTIGLVASLQYLGRLEPGAHRIETPVGEVQTVLHADGRVSVANVASYRHRPGVRLAVAGYGEVTGDVAWGGNWFFLVTAHTHPFELELARAEELTAYSWAIRQALEGAEVTGAGGAEIDHIELYGPAQPGADSKNFVLCPGRAYDRSPCGTGTSAKLACLAADGKLKLGAVWRQAGILDTVFEGSIAERDGELYPTITGRAWVTARAELLFEPGDPFAGGIPGAAARGEPA